MQCAVLLSASQLTRSAARGCCPLEEFGFTLELTLGSQRRHVLMTPAMNLMAVGIHSKDQDHDAAHDASGHGTHGGTFNHVQCDHLITFVQINKQMSLVTISQVWQEVRMGVRWEGTEQGGVWWRQGQLL